MQKKATQLVLTKAVDWAYEREFRIIGSPKLQGTPLLLDGEYLHLSTGSLVSVIIGCEAPRNDIAKLVSTCAPRLPIKYAERVPNQYKLQII